jgi:pimeloyl-ACP methyl ester carboxylesterase
MTSRHRTVEVDGLKVFYREAGTAGVPKLLLLHGFLSSSHMFRDRSNPGIPQIEVPSV